MSDTAGWPSGTGEAAGALAEIHRRQGRVIRAVLVPVWYWWVMAAGMVAIGAARDGHDLVVQAVTVPLAVLVMILATAAMVPAARRRVQVYGAMKPGARGAAAIFGLIVLVNALTISTAATLDADRASYPLTIGYAAGGAVLVIAGPVVNRYLHSLMLSHARRRMDDAAAGRGRTA